MRSFLLSEQCPGRSSWRNHTCESCTWNHRELANLFTLSDSLGEGGSNHESMCKSLTTELSWHLYAVMSVVWKALQCNAIMSVIFNEILKTRSLKHFSPIFSLISDLIIYSEQAILPWYSSELFQIVIYFFRVWCLNFQLRIATKQNMFLN